MKETTTRDAIFALEKLKNYLLMSKDGNVYHILDWDIAEKQKATTITKKRLFGFEKTIAVPETAGYVSVIRTKNSENVNTTWHRLWEFTSLESDKLCKVVNLLQEDRDRFKKMSEELQKFGFIISSKPEETIEEQIREAKASGALGDITGTAGGRGLGIL